MGECFRLASDLETASIELSRAKDLLAILSINLFEEELTEYAQQYEAVVDAAWHKVSEQNKNINKIALELYQIGKGEK